MRRFSPSRLYGFTECKTCFWIEQNIGKHPFTLPLLLNDAMDSILKSRYDSFRKKGQLPPELRELGGYSLFMDMATLESWRTKPSSLAYKNEKDGYELYGKLDEVLIDPQGHLVPADYKSSGNPPKEDKYKYYELQLNAYAVMIKDKGYPVAKEAFLLHYFPTNRTGTSLEIEFSNHFDRVKLDEKNFLKTMKEMVKLVNSPLPESELLCKKCAWSKKVHGYRK